MWNEQYTRLHVSGTKIYYKVHPAVSLQELLRNTLQQFNHGSLFEKKACSKLLYIFEKALFPTLIFKILHDFILLFILSWTFLFFNNIEVYQM